MSWQAYVDQMVGTKKVTKGAIVGLSDKAVWAASAGLSLKPEEISALISAFKDPSGIRASGATLSGQSYFVLKCDERSIYLKQGNAGAICVKTGRTVLVGFYSESIQPGLTSPVVEKLADQLIEMGY